MWRKTLLAAAAALVLATVTLSTISSQALIPGAGLCITGCFAGVRQCELECLAQPNLPNLELCEAVCQVLLDSCIDNCTGS